MDSLVEKGTFKVVRSGGVPKRKKRKPKRVRFMPTENEAPAVSVKPWPGHTVNGWEEAPSAPEVTPAVPKTVALMARYTVNGVEVSSEKAPKVDSVPTHVRVQSPSLGGISSAAVRAVVGTEMMSHDPLQVQGVDLGLSLIHI